MSRLRLLIAAVAALVVPAPAGAGLASITSRDVPLRGERSLNAVAPVGGFELVGLHWKGSGRLEYRTLSASGRWSAWEQADADIGPDAGTREQRRLRDWHLGEGVWVGPSTRVEVRAGAGVARVRAYTVRSPISRVPIRQEAVARGPSIVTRAAWLADESIRRDEPELAPTLRFAVVHHTAGRNVYTREEAPAIVRAIELYHVKGNGWNDIGYNALVDRFGTVYEGRYGGLENNVVGAHAKGFNTGSFGIAVLGELTTLEPPRPALDALARTIAWRLDLVHVDPRGTLDAISNGNERFQPGIPVFLRAISGHRDTGLTSCPGNTLYARLPELAQQAGAIGLPKLYEPLVEGEPGGALAFTARLSSPRPWTVTVSDASGAVATTVTGSGPAVEATWDSSGAAPGVYRWRIDAGPEVTAAVGTLVATDASRSLALAGASASPETITPNGDGQSDSTTIAYQTTANASIAASLFDASGVEVAQIEKPHWRRAGEHTIHLDGDGLADGVYELGIVARGTGGAEATASVSIAVTRTLGAVSLSSPVLTLDGDGTNERLVVRVSLSSPAAVKVRIVRDGRSVWTLADVHAGPGPLELEWDGMKRSGKLLDGRYDAVVEATDVVGTARVELPFLADATKPRLRLLSTRPPRLWVSEPATIRVRINGARRKLVAKAAGPVRIPGFTKTRALVATARDEAGNHSLPIAIRLELAATAGAGSPPG